MIINQDIKPEKQAYYLGSKVLAEIQRIAIGANRRWGIIHKD